MIQKILILPVVVACILNVPRDFPFVAPSVGSLEVSISSEVIVETVKSVGLFPDCEVKGFVESSVVSELDIVLTVDSIIIAELMGWLEGRKVFGGAPDDIVEKVLDCSAVVLIYVAGLGWVDLGKLNEDEDIVDKKMELVVFSPATAFVDPS